MEMLGWWNVYNLGENKIVPKPVFETSKFANCEDISYQHFSHTTG